MDIRTTDEEHSSRIGVLGIKKPNGALLPEAKRLMEEIEKQGHEPVFINYRRLAVSITQEGRSIIEYDSTGNTLNEVQVDAIIPRIGRFHDVGILAMKAFEAAGVPLAGSQAVTVAKNKIATQILLDKAVIPTPYSVCVIGKQPEKSDGFLKMIQPNYRGRVVIKSATGSHGKGVVLADSRSSARSIINSFPDEPYIIQEFIEPDNDKGYHDDIRIIVIRDRVVAAMRRFTSSRAEEQEFRSNLSLGGQAELYQPTPRETELAIRAAQVAGLDICGVDIMHSARGPVVTEINDNPELGIEKHTNINVAQMIAQAAIESVRPS